MKKKLFREKYFFILVALANLFPLFLSRYFPTLDGPSHLYNSRLILSMLTGESPETAAFFEFNAFVFTNLSGHFLLAFFNSFLPAFMAEKALMILILLGIPISFRALVSSFSDKNNYLTYLVFPFTWSQLFMFGFYNYLLGLIFMMLALALWVRSYSQPGFKYGLLLFILFLLTAASHIFTFLLAIAFCFSWIIWAWLVRGRESERGITVPRGAQWLMTAGFLLLTAAGGLIILMLYFIGPAEVAGIGHITGTFAQAFYNIRIVKPMLALMDTEQIYSEKYFWWMAAMALAALIIRIYQHTAKGTGFKIAGKIRMQIMRSDYFFIAAILFMGLFIVYDVYFNTGLFISERLIYMGFLLWVAWLACQKFHRVFVVISVVIALTLNFILLAERTPYYKALGRQADEFIAVSEHIEAGSVVYPVNFSANWLLFHVQDYIGAENPVVMLSNYECEQKYFPLRWKHNKAGISSMIKQAYPEIITRHADSSAVFDYLLVYDELEGEYREQYDIFREQVNSKFTKVAVSPSGLISLYALRL